MNSHITRMLTGDIITCDINKINSQQCVTSVSAYICLELKSDFFERLAVMTRITSSQAIAFNVLWYLFQFYSHSIWPSRWSWKSKAKSDPVCHSNTATSMPYITDDIKYPDVHLPCWIHSHVSDVRKSGDSHTNSNSNNKMWCLLRFSKTPVL